MSDQPNVQELLAAAQRMSERVRVLREALQAVDALIYHQYTGSRAAMNALQSVCDKARAALKATQ